MNEDAELTLSRWSRLKRKSVETAEPESGAPEGMPESEPKAMAGASLVADEGPGSDAAGNDIADEVPDLPSLESLDKDSDYTPFLGKNVPQDIARAAFRKLWRSDPVFANLDGLNDYDEDFNLIEELVSVVSNISNTGEAVTEPDQPTPDDAGDQAVGDQVADEQTTTDSTDELVVQDEKTAEHAPGDGSDAEKEAVSDAPDDDEAIKNG